MHLHGKNSIGGAESAEGTSIFQAMNPATGLPLPTGFYEAAPGEIDRSVRVAEEAFQPYRRTSAEQRARFLEAIASEIEALGDELLGRAHLETALPEARLKGERQRTMDQARMFATVVREGSWVEARIDPAMPDRKPLPRPDLRRMLIPLGPVAVFGASNFPFAFSTPGGDTVSALAAGCPVIVKGHPAHPGASEMAARAIAAAAEATGMPAGVFSLIHGHARVGVSLVRHPLLQAVAFTGSLKGGRAIFDAAVSRERPIPVYAEMGSVNPVFILPGALREGSARIAEGLKAAVTLGVGQFCTNPGLVVGLDDAGFRGLVRELAEKLSGSPAGTMLTAGICRAYGTGTERLQSQAGVNLESQAGNADPALSQATPAVFSTTGGEFLQSPDLAEEVFGPSTLMIACGSPTELAAVARTLEGQLTATIHGTPADLEEYHELVNLLEARVGRLIFNGYPTGVEVCSAMQHGGPYPASTDSRTTSVGTAAIARFARPICYQDWPQNLLPPELQDANPMGIPRLVDGEWTR